MKYRPPGLLRAGLNPDVIMMICTAGHVDHGKTELVKLLTGCMTDRLKEEQERGLTIELGFAPCFLGGNLCVGIVDVPGHEKFVKNMVAGVSGIDLAILVIAADDGVMPQTSEHLQIMELLGIQQGIVALTKTDLVDEDRVKEASDEIREFIKGTFLESAEICPLSSVTLEGYDTFYNLLVDKITAIKKQAHHGIFRMPVYKTFTREGFGVVATGIPVDGTIKVGDKVETVPGNRAGKIRGIQRFLRDADSGATGQCLALNIPEFSRIPPERGEVITIPGYLKASTIFHILIKTIPGLKEPLKNAGEIKFHTGTTEEHGKIYILEKLSEGESQTYLASVILANPIAAAINDRVIVRKLTPVETVAGGEIIDITYDGKRPRRPIIVKKLKQYLKYFDGVEKNSEEWFSNKVEYALVSQGIAGATVSAVAKLILLPDDIVLNYVRKLKSDDKVVVIGGDTEDSLMSDLIMHKEIYTECYRKIRSRIIKARDEEKAISLSIGELGKELNLKSSVWAKIRDELAAEKLIVIKGNKLILKGAESKFSDKENAVIERILKIYNDSGFESPRPVQISEMLNVDSKLANKLLEYLYNEGELIKVAQNVVLSYRHYKTAQDMVVKIIKENGSLNSGDFKGYIKSSRKYAIAILDFMDEKRITLRKQNERILTPVYERYLI